MQEEIIGKKCLSTKLKSGLYPSINFGKYNLEVGPVFWTLLSDGFVVTHCYQVADISEYYLEQLIGSELLGISTNNQETQIKIGEYILRLNSFKSDNFDHYKIFDNLLVDDGALCEFISNIPDITCSKAVNTFGTTLLIDFGAKKENGKFPLTIMVESSDWSIQNNNSPVSIEKLIGTKLIDIKINIDGYESDLIFDNGTKIHTKQSSLNTSQWILSLNGKHLTYGPKNIILLS